MPGGPSLRALAPLAGVLLALVFALPAAAQPGRVHAHQKISDLEGNFTPVIDDLDELAGAAVGLGDLDGPGPAKAAVALGAAYDDDGGGDRGAVYIAFLDAAGMVLSHRKISDTVNFPGGPLDSGDQFGSAVAFLGDLDGAGPAVAAIAVGAVGDDDGVPGAGAVYLLFLDATSTVLSWRKISDTTNLPGGPLDGLDEFGGAVAGLGDLDGAGPAVSALAVGAIGDDDGGPDLGAVYLLFLDPTGTVLSWTKVSDTTNFPGAPLDAGDDFGTALAAVGDLDGAGPAVLALAVGAALDDDGGSDRGAVYILFLDAAGTVLSSQKLSDTQGNFTATFRSYDEFGGSLTHLGDLDGPGGGVTALAVGAAGDDDGGVDRGAVHILFLNANGTCSGHRKISSLSGDFTATLDNLDGFGTSLAFLGDLDGPGPCAAAVLVGASADDDGGPDRGAGYVLFLEGSSVVGVDPVVRPGSTGGLGAARPNPFRPATLLPFRLDQAGEVRIEVWDLSGRRVRALIAARLPAGDHRVLWDGRDDAGRAAATGAYFFRMSLDGRPQPGAAKAVLLR